MKLRLSVNWSILIDLLHFFLFSFPENRTEDQVSFPGLKFPRLMKSNREISCGLTHSLYLIHELHSLMVGKSQRIAPFNKCDAILVALCCLQWSCTCQRPDPTEILRLLSLAPTGDGVNLSWALTGLDTYFKSGVFGRCVAPTRHGHCYPGCSLRIKCCFLR